MAFAYSGDFVGLGAEGQHVMNAQAIKRSRLRCMSTAMLHRSASEDPTLAFKLYEALTRELAATQDLMLATGQHRALERVAGFLLAFSRRNARYGQDPTNISLPMSRADIGDFLGLAFETVSRNFTQLKSLGLINIPISNNVILLDIVALTNLFERKDRSF
jgi:CRP/FNR family transcriptional regulator